jgi:hypothetical protein
MDLLLEQLVVAVVAVDAVVIYRVFFQIILTVVELQAIELVEQVLDYPKSQINWLLLQVLLLVGLQVEHSMVLQLVEQWVGMDHCQQTCQTNLAKLVV